MSSNQRFSHLGASPLPPLSLSTKPVRVGGARFSRGAAVPPAVAPRAAAPAGANGLYGTLGAAADGDGLPNGFPDPLVEAEGGSGATATNVCLSPTVVNCRPIGVGSGADANIFSGGRSRCVAFAGLGANGLKDLTGSTSTTGGVAGSTNVATNGGFSSTTMGVGANGLLVAGVGACICGGSICSAMMTGNSFGLGANGFELYKQKN